MSDFSIRSITSTTEQEFVTLRSTDENLFPGGESRFFSQEEYRQLWEVLGQGDFSALELQSQSARPVRFVLSPRRKLRGEFIESSHFNPQGFSYGDRPEFLRQLESYVQSVVVHHSGTEYWEMDEEIECISLTVTLRGLPPLTMDARAARGLAFRLREATIEGKRIHASLYRYGEQTFLRKFAVFQN